MTEPSNVRYESDGTDDRAVHVNTDGAGRAVAFGVGTADAYPAAYVSLPRVAVAALAGQLVQWLRDTEPTG